jgi:hypothetical protein
VVSPPLNAGDDLDAAFLSSAYVGGLTKVKRGRRFGRGFPAKRLRRWSDQGEARATIWTRLSRQALTTAV